MIKGPIIIKQIGGATAQIPECGDKNYLTNTSDFIVAGTIQNIDTKWNDERTRIFTYFDLIIKDYLKGPLIENDKLQVIIPGGCADDICEGVEDVTSILSEGKNVIIYFKKTNDEYSITCGRDSIEEIEITRTEEVANRIVDEGYNLVDMYIKENSGTYSFTFNTLNNVRVTIASTSLYNKLWRTIEFSYPDGTAQLIVLDGPVFMEPGTPNPSAISNAKTNLITVLSHSNMLINIPKKNEQFNLRSDEDLQRFIVLMSNTFKR